MVNSILVKDSSYPPFSISCTGGRITGRVSNGEPEIMMNNQDYYRDKICIVTGADSGIGYEPGAVFSDVRRW